MTSSPQSDRRLSRRTSTSVAAASAAVLAVVLAGCSSSGANPHADKGSTGFSPLPTSTPATSTPAASTPAATPATAASSAAAPVPTSGSPADAATKKAVSTVYETFFTPNTKPAVAQAELQNGVQFTSSLAALAKTAKQQNTSVTVSAVSVAGPVATVTFTLYGGNHAPLLPDTHGFAVLVNGKWQVAAQTFCALVTLQGPAPAACKDPKYTALPH